MLIDPTSSTTGFFIQEDNYLLSTTQIVTIYCPHKKSAVEGILSNDIETTGSSHWQPLFDSGGGGIASLVSPLLDIVNSAEELSKGQTIRQPWMSRKTYQKSDPLSFTISLQFVSRGDANNQVWMPILTLLSYVYPRKAKNGGENDSLAGYLIDLASSKLNSKTATAISSELNARMYIPGPLVTQSNENKDDDSDEFTGDPVFVVIGGRADLTFYNVYIETCDIKLSHTLDSSGYPLSGQATIKFTLADTNSCDYDGNFSLSPASVSPAVMSGLKELVNMYQNWTKEQIEAYEKNKTEAAAEKAAATTN